MAPDDSEDAERVGIVYAYARTDPGDPSSLEPRTTTVPAGRYAAVRHADRAFQGVGDEWIRKPGVRSVGLGGDDGRRIVVEMDRT